MSLAYEWPVGGVISNEAGIVLGGHAMQKESVTRNLGRLNSLYGGVIPDTKRATGGSYPATNARLTVSLQAQEQVFRTFFENTKGLARGSGFFARFLVTWPESTMGTRFYVKPTENWPALGAFNQRVTQILDTQLPIDSITDEICPAMLQLSPDAKTVWIDYHDSIEGELKVGGEMADVKDVASKSADNAARIACLLHVFEGRIGPVGADTMRAACRIAMWHLFEAKRFLNELALPSEMINASKLEAWLIDFATGNKITKIKKNEALQRGPLRKKDVLDAAIADLTELGRVRLCKDGKTTLIEIRSELLPFATGIPAIPAIPEEVAT